MSLEPGTKLGAFHILDAIGAGGMGEVYRARDTTLDRDVAIKVLPEELAADEERIARFEREAKLLASLNHPNIASIYGFEAGALVLELVEGPTLAERIGSGRLSTEEAVAIARQIADALEAGHEAGVIHRDLKPANVKVKEDGTIKVLDYGLAKALESDTPAGSDAELSQSPTLTRQGTQVGVILGTASYMSPEQARGKRVDRRTDIWAFGCVLYEMLTGNKAFAGDDVSEILAAVINLEPDWRELDPRLTKVLRRTLEKDPKKRRRDIGDVRTDIDEALETPALRPTATRGGRVALFTALVGALAGVAVSALITTPPSEPPVTRFDIARADGAVSSSRRVAITRDGRTIAYRNDGGLHVRRLESKDTISLPGTEGAAHPVFSPDGEWIAFWFDGMHKVPVDGGPPVRLNFERDRLEGISWAGNHIYYASGEGNIMRMSDGGGEPELVLEAGEHVLLHPRLLPDGTTLLYTESNATMTSQSVVAYTLDSDVRRVLVERGADAQYVGSGHLVYRAGNVLRAVPFDLGRVEVTGKDAIVVPDVAPVGGGLDRGAGDFAVSESGNLLYHSGGDGQNRLIWVDRRGVVEPLDVPPAGYTGARISPDGTRLVIEQEGDLWLYDLARGAVSRLTFTGDNLRAVWTADGAHIVFSSNRAGNHHVYRQPADGSRDAEQLTDGEVMQHPDAVAPDGSIVFHQHDVDARSSDLWLLDIEKREGRPLLPTEFREATASVSPDGRWLAYTSNESGRDEVHVRPFPGGGAKTVVSTGGGSVPKWSRDARELFYRHEFDVMAVDIDSGDELVVGTPRRLFEARFATISRAPSFDVTGDGERFLLVESGESSRAQLHVVVNFSEELKRVVPSEN